MSIKPKKILLIGVDQAIPCFVKRFSEENLLPNISNLINNGVYGEAFSCPPCDTPTNWATIATGATTAVHGATSFYVHLPGEPFDMALKHRLRSSLSRLCTAEYFWDVADRHGFAPFVLNYPAGWPSNFNNGAMSLLTWPTPESLPRNVSYPLTKKFTRDSENPSLLIKEADKPIIEFLSQSAILEIDIEITHSEIKKPPIIKAYIVDTNGGGYNALVVPSDVNDTYQTVLTYEWTDWIPLNVKTVHGELPCLIKIQVVEIEKDGSSLRLKGTNLFNTKGWTKPDDLGEGLVRNAITYEAASEQMGGFIIKGMVKQYILKSRKEASTLSNSIKYAKDTMDWRVCFFHIHLLDSVNHRSLALLYEKSPLYNEKKAEKTLNHVKMSYEIVDEMVGNLVKSCVDEETVVVFLADHGAIPSWRVANIPVGLKNAGLMSYKEEKGGKNFVVDWDKTVAFPYMEPHYVWVNLKGRDPQGSVEPSDYDSVRDDIIQALYNMKDPETGRKIIKLALTKEDAAVLGQDGERIGDVVYFLNTPYQLFDGMFEQLDASVQPATLLNRPEAYKCAVNYAAHAYYLPNERLGEYSISVPLNFSGPGIEKGLELKRPVNLVDVAPTLSHLLGIPQPKNSQGRVLHEILR